MLTGPNVPGGSLRGKRVLAAESTNQGFGGIVQGLGFRGRLPGFFSECLGCPVVDASPQIPASSTP